MKNDKKQQLIDLGAQSLAKALLDLAAQSGAAEDLVDRLLASPAENIKRYKKKLAGLKRSRRFIDWRGVTGFARDLEMLLQDLKAGVSDPLIGVELVAAFYEADESIFEQCDDSAGSVGGVFLHEAKELFVEYARGCDDEQKIADIILNLNLKSGYGVRDTLIDCAGGCLSEPIIRAMIARLRKRADREHDEYGRRRHLGLIESLARQIKDAQLFEKTRIESWGELSEAAVIDIARVYLESGDAEAARSRVEKIPENETSFVYERDQLLLEIFQNQGNTEKLTNILYRKFRSNRSIDTLQALLDVIGNDKRDGVILDEIPLILGDSALRRADANFLMATGKIDEAETYVLERAERLDGEAYSSLLDLAEAFVSENRHLAASLIYRSLLISILERGYTKAYPHGIRYLKKLDNLAQSITDWRVFDTHNTFKDRIYKAHSRKKSFWSKYEVNQ